MSMVAGSVVVNQTTEAVTGSGMALALYNAEIVNFTSLLTSQRFQLPTLGSTVPPYNTQRPVTQADIDAVQAQRLTLINAVRDRANAYAAALVTYIQTNATAGGDPVT